MTLALLVGLASAAGACSRYLIDRAVQALVAVRFPAGTMTVNLTGCLLAGLVAGLAARGVPESTVVVVTAGYCGGLTTWSTWAWETAELTSERHVLLAVANVAASLAAGIALMWAGLALSP